MINYRFELTHSGGYLYENDIRDLEYLAELGMIGIDDLIRQAVDHINHKFFGKVRVEYYVGHIIYGENSEKIFEAKHQVLSTYRYASSDFRSLDRVVSSIYGANPLVGPSLRKLFSEEYAKFAGNLSVLFSELMDERIRMTIVDLETQYTRPRIITLDHIPLISNHVV